MSNIIMYKGETNIISFEVIDETVTPNIPFDITGYTLYLTVKKRKDDTDANALIQKTQILHDNATNGQSHFEILAIDTANMDYDDYVFDIEIRSFTEDVIRTVLVGHIEIQEKVKD